MRIAILQPSYLPWLGYFDQMARADLFVIYDDAQYTKNDWRNRNRIKGESGPVWLTVPVHGSIASRICDVQVSSQKQWGKRHCALLYEHYQNSPFYSEVMSFFAPLWGMKSVSLLEITLSSINLAREYIELHTPMILSSSLNIHGKKSEKLVEICRAVGATEYLSGSSARNYIDLNLFSQAGVSVEFQDYQHPTYPQLHGRFSSHLSIIDLLLNCGPMSKNIYNLGGE